MEKPNIEINNQKGLASEYHRAKLERKCLTPSFKVKSNSGKATHTRASAELQFKERPTTRSQDVPTKPKPNLAMEYHATRRSYKASSQVRENEGNRDKFESNTPAATSDASLNVSETASNGNNQMRHTSMSGYELLGIHRLEDKNCEFGLSDGIQLHLVESIKLCGIRKAREKSITDMIATLCNHLSDRENEIKKWMTFADNVVITAAEKLSQSMLDHDDAMSTVEKYRKASRTTKLRMATARERVMTLRKELNSIKSDVDLMMTQFALSLNDSWKIMKEGSSSYLATLRSTFKSDLTGALDDLSRKHEKEKLRMESQISSLQSSIQSEREKLTMLNDKLNAASIAVGEEKHKRVSLQKDLDLEHQSLNGKLDKSNEEISRLKGLLENERSSKRQELAAMQERMDQEFDEIETKVKRSMKLLVESKNKEIAEALRRAKDAEQVLSELRATVLPVISTAEDSCEK